MSLIPSTPFGATVGGASTLSGNTLGSELVYYCCRCRYGPQLVSLYPSCINCEHHSCGCCETDTTEKISDRGIAPATAADILGCTNASSNVDSTHQHLPSTTPSKSPVHKITDMDVTPAICVHFSDEKPIDGGGYVWFCCNCGDGPMGGANNLACSDCRHQRCSSCAIEPQK